MLTWINVILQIFDSGYSTETFQCIACFYENLIGNEMESKTECRTKMKYIHMIPYAALDNRTTDEL